MSLSIKKLTFNTKINKENKEGAPSEGGGGGGPMPESEKEDLIEECLNRVRDLIDYELRP
jgi:hypothetical protein